MFYERGQDLGAEPRFKDKSTSTDIDMTKLKEVPPRVEASDKDSAVSEADNTQQEKNSATIKTKRKYTKRSILTRSKHIF
jgi:hypothetical protein